MDSKVCTNCNQKKKLSEFYSRKGRNLDHYSHCKECNKYLTLKRQRKTKRKAIEYKGGKCQKCGFDKCIGALQFHHMKEKDKNWNQFKSRRFDDKFKEELDKCLLLCANCHATIHTSYCM